ALIQQRQLVPKMLSVVRTLAVQMPTDENVQLAFGEALGANEKGGAAAEVYRRMLRRGVSNVSTLAQVKQQLAQIEPQTADAGTTLDTLAAEVAADPSNTAARLRLAKALYYSL